MIKSLISLLGETSNIIELGIFFKLDLPKEIILSIIAISHPSIFSLTKSGVNRLKISVYGKVGTFILLEGLFTILL